MIDAVDRNRLFVGSCKTASDAHAFIDVKSFSGWRVLVPPFVTDQLLMDHGEDTTRPVDVEWTFVLHRL